jgi:uncharacterized protein (DUF4415 family)
MKQRRRVSKNGKSGRISSRSSTARSLTARSTRSGPSKPGARRKSGKGKALSLRASFEEALKFYRPIKKPVTLRLDADVIAWFKKDGRRYQTRINAALRRVMTREMRAAE